MRSFGITGWRAVVAVALASLVSNAVQAGVVAIDLDLPIDQVAPGTGGIKVGDHHRARVFYDTSEIDPKTHRVKPLHMQHLVAGQWIPVRLDPVAMPMDDAWLDVGTSPYTYHYHSKSSTGGTTDFDEQARRMVIRRGDNSVVVSAPYIVDQTPVADPALYTLTAPPPKFVIRNVDVHLDRVQVPPGQGGGSKVGDIDKVRVVYDASLIDPRTHHVHLVNFQHFIHGSYMPAHPDAVFMPVRDAWIDMSNKPYRIHFHAAVTHGSPILIDVDEDSMRLSIRSQADSSQVLMAGEYVVDSSPISGPEADAAATPVSPAPQTTPADRAPR